jgi:predicted RNA-binding Zn-ribbon protein involved in translation (DUF1610 family)
VTKKKLPAEKKILPAEESVLPGGAKLTASPRSESGAAGPVTLARPAGSATGTAQPPEPPSKAKKPSAADFFRSQKPAADYPASCMECGWVGRLGDCKEKELGASKTGWAWNCPRCGEVVSRYAFVLI